LIAGRKWKFVIVVGERADRIVVCGSSLRPTPARRPRRVSFEHDEELTADDRAFSPSAGGHRSPGSRSGRQHVRSRGDS
jgi:hypothetical protein